MAIVISMDFGNRFFKLDMKKMSIQMLTLSRFQCNVLFVAFL